MNEGLALCPFCGHDNAMMLPPTCRPETPYNAADRLFPIVRCGSCCAEVSGDNEDYRGASAIAAWNRRAPSPDMREAVEARPGGSTTAFTRDQLARLAFVVFYSPVLCASQNIKAVADEIDCCPGCDHVSSGGTCHVSYRGDYCPNDLAETLRQIGVALYGPGNPSHYVESVFGPDQMPVFRSLTGAKP